MLGLITDRTAENVERLSKLNTKGWSNMTTFERAEWLGDPLDAATIGYSSPVNIIPTNCVPVTGTVIYDSNLNIREGPGFDYAVIGTLYKGEKFTLLERSGDWGRISAGWINLSSNYVTLDATLVFRNTSVTATGNGYAVIIIGEASKFDGVTLTLSAAEINATDGGEAEIMLCWHDDSGYESAGESLTEAGGKTLTLEENTADRSYLALYLYANGGTVRYSGLMLEIGSVRHDYVPYTPILPTATTKGAYNYSDLNRVEKAVSEIAELLGWELETKTDWSRWDVPTDSDLERYLGNVKKIRDACSIVMALPNKIDYEAANNIEKILGAAHEVANAIPRSGELYCGEV